MLREYVSGRPRGRGAYQDRNELDGSESEKRRDPLHIEPGMQSKRKRNENQGLVVCLCFRDPPFIR